MRVLLLPVGEGTWCVPLVAVREVLTAPRTSPVPTAKESVMGLFNLRGSVLPLFDTGVLLGLPSTCLPSTCPASTWRAHAAVVEVAAGLAALVTTGTPRTAELGPVVGAPEHAAALGTYDVLPLTGPDGVSDGTHDVAVLLDLERLLG